MYGKWEICGVIHRATIIGQYGRGPGKDRKRH